MRRALIISITLGIILSATSAYGDWTLRPTFPKSPTFTGPVKFADGTPCSAPTIARSADVTDGISFAATYFAWGINGVCEVLVGSSVAVGSDAGYTWSSTTDPTGTSDLKLFRAGAKQLSLQGGTAGSLTLDFSVFTAARLWQFRADNADYFVGEATVQALSNKTTIQTSGNVGIGTAPSGTVGRLLEVGLNGNQTTRIAVSNTDAAGTAAIAAVRAGADVAAIQTSAFGTANTASLFGITVGGYSSINNAAAGSGIIIGTTNATPLRFGTGGDEIGIYIDGTNPHPSFPVSHKRLTVQFDKTDTTLSDVTGLSVNVTAGKTYECVSRLYTTSDVAGGVKFAIGGTATATAVIYEVVVANASTIAAQTRATSLGTAVGGVTAVTAAFATITTTITVNAAGTLTTQFAENAATATSSVLVNSTMSCLEVQ